MARGSGGYRWCRHGSCRRRWRSTPTTSRRETRERGTPSASGGAPWGRTSERSAQRRWAPPCRSRSSSSGRWRTAPDPGCSRRRARTVQAPSPTPDSAPSNSPCRWRRARTPDDSRGGPGSCWRRLFRPCKGHCSSRRQSRTPRRRHGRTAAAGRWLRSLPERRHRTGRSSRRWWRRPDPRDDNRAPPPRRRRPYRRRRNSRRCSRSFRRRARKPVRRRGRSRTRASNNRSVGRRAVRRTRSRRG